MSATNATTNYGFPLFLETDKPGWLTDFNTAMTKIDEVIKNVSDKDINVEEDIQTLKDAVGTPAGSDPDTQPATGFYKEFQDTNAAVSQNAANISSANNAITTLDNEVSTLTQTTTTNTASINQHTTQINQQTQEINSLDDRVTNLEDSGTGALLKTYQALGNVTNIQGRNTVTSNLTLQPGYYYIIASVNLSTVLTTSAASTIYAGLINSTTGADIDMKEIPLLTNEQVVVNETVTFRYHPTTATRVGIAFTGDANTQASTSNPQFYSDILVIPVEAW